MLLNYLYKCWSIQLCDEIRHAQISMLYLYQKHRPTAKLTALVADA